MLVASSLVFIYFGLSLVRRLRHVRRLLVDISRWSGTESFTVRHIFQDFTGRRRYNRINDILMDSRVLPLLPPAIAVGSWLFVWLVVVRYGYLLYVPFTILVVFLIFNRPQDAIEAYSLSGRFLKSDGAGMNRSDWFLLAQAYERIVRARWYYLVIGAGFTSFVAGDYIFGSSLTGWLTTNTRVGSHLGSQLNWQFTLFLLLLGVTAAASVLLWPVNELELDMSYSESGAKSLEKLKELEAVRRLLLG